MLMGLFRVQIYAVESPKGLEMMLVAKHTRAGSVGEELFVVNGARQPE